MNNMEKFLEGDVVLYQNGDCFELGVVKRVCDNGDCFVWYHTGDTAARTPSCYLHKLANSYAFSIKRLSCKPVSNFNSEALEVFNKLEKHLFNNMSVEIGDYDESNYCMSYQYVDLGGEGLQFNDEIDEEEVISILENQKLLVIKQALLKEQEQEKALNLIKKFIWFEEGQLKCGRFGDIEIDLDESDFENKEDFYLLKKLLNKKEK